LKLISPKAAGLLPGADGVLGTRHFKLNDYEQNVAQFCCAFAGHSEV
jgi:hypothetical protein